MKHRDIKNIDKSNDSYFENDSVIGVLSDDLKENILVGSFVIIPKSQVEIPFDMTEKEWLDTKEMMTTIKEYIDKEYKPDGYNIGWNIGSVGGQNIIHAHLHIIPRYKDEPYAGKGIRYWFKQEENKRECFKDKC